jgi:hypothetical protein
MHSSKLWIVFVAILATSCTLPQSDPTGFVPMQEAPVPGFNKVSEFFGVEVTGGIFSPRKIKIFHIQSEDQNKELIGSDFFPVYQSRQGAYAVSDDGRTLLFIHNELLNTRPLSRTSGLYEYVHGRGTKLLESSAHGGIYINDILPSNAIVFRRKNCTEAYCFDEPIVVRTTNGAEHLRERPKKPMQPTR